MAPGTRGEGRPAECLEAASGNSSGPTAWGFDSAIETPPAEYGLAMLASSGKSDGEVEQVKRRISPAGLRVAWRSSAALTFPSPAGRISLFRPPGVLLPKPGGQKIAWAFVGLSHPGLEFSSFSGGALWHTRSTRQRDERQYS
jgi:hypothetical protein